MRSDKISLSTQFAGMQLDNCIYNASGPWCTSRKELKRIGSSSSAAILTKSATLNERVGNPSPRYFENDLGSINSMGLPNKGYKFYIENAEYMTSEFPKPYILSLAGLCLEDNIEMLEATQDNEFISAIELNLSCPNVPGKAQTAYDFAQIDKVLSLVSKYDKHPLGIKLPPYFDIIHFHEVAAIINQYDVAFVTCINSIGNGLVIDIDKEAVVIRPKGGFGGIGGDYIKPTALANVRKFRELLKSETAIIGCGGIKTGADAFEHILCGADAIQIGTQFRREGEACFGRIKNELLNIMKQKGYESILDFKSMLRTY